MCLLFKALSKVTSLTYWSAPTHILKYKVKFQETAYFTLTSGTLSMSSLQSGPSTYTSSHPSAYDYTIQNNSNSVSGG